MSLTRSKAVLELGGRLVEQLDASDDLLASWMAHDIAQRIEAAERAPAEDKAEAHDACAKAILELWRYRSALPSHLRPLGELEPVLRTIASLDVDGTKHRYYPEALQEAATADVDEATKQLLELALGIDYSARLLIQSVLRSAAHHAASESEPWVKLALLAGADEGAEGPVVKFILGDYISGKIDEDQEAAMRDKLSRLESFSDLAATFVRGLNAQLEVNNDDEK